MSAHQIASFADAVQAFGADNDAYDKAAIAQAKHLHGSEGVVEVDGNPGITSRADDADGCYVMAWVWVPAADIDAQMADDAAPTNENGERKP